MTDSTGQLKPAIFESRNLTTYKISNPKKGLTENFYPGRAISDSKHVQI